MDRRSIVEQAALQVRLALLLMGPGPHPRMEVRRVLEELAESLREATELDEGFRAALADRVVVLSVLREIKAGRQLDPIN